MKQHFTQDQLIKYLYQEISAAEALSIAEALESDPVLRQDYEELLEAHRQLPQVSFRPSSSVIAQILEYSKATSLETQY